MEPIDVNGLPVSCSMVSPPFSVQPPGAMELVSARELDHSNLALLICSLG